MPRRAKETGKEVTRKGGKLLRQLGAYIEPALDDRLREHCRREGKQVAWVVTRGIEMYLEAEEKRARVSAALVEMSPAELDAIMQAATSGRKR